MSLKWNTKDRIEKNGLNFSYLEIKFVNVMFLIVCKTPCPYGCCNAFPCRENLGKIKVNVYMHMQFVIDWYFSSPLTITWKSIIDFATHSCKSLFTVLCLADRLEPSLFSFLKTSPSLCAMVSQCNLFCWSSSLRSEMLYVIEVEACTVYQSIHTLHVPLFCLSACLSDYTCLFVQLWLSVAIW